MDPGSQIPGPTTHLICSPNQDPPTLQPTTNTALANCVAFSSLFQAPCLRGDLLLRSELAKKCVVPRQQHTTDDVLATDCNGWHLRVAGHSAQHTNVVLHRRPTGRDERLRQVALHGGGARHQAALQLGHCGCDSSAVHLWYIRRPIARYRMYLCHHKCDLQAAIHKR